MLINESLKAKYDKSYNAAILSRWAPIVEGVKKVYPDYSDVSSVNLAILCENLNGKLDEYRRHLGEATQTGGAVPGDVGPYIRHAFELIAGVMPNLVIDEVVSIQALKQKIGQIFFLKYVYGSNKGSVKKGDVAFGPYDINSQPDYTSEHIDQEILLAEVTEATATVSLQWGPLTAGTVVLTCGAATAHDNGQGAIEGDFTGTIDYEAQTIALEGLPTTGATLEAAYDYNLSYAPSEAPEFDMKIEERIVIARPRKLRARYSFDAAYDVEKQFGLNMDDELLEASVTEIKHEIDQEILGDLYRQAGLTNTWDATRPQAISLDEHYETFNKKIIEMSNQIFKANKRGTGNVLIAGLNVANVVESLKNFIPAADAADASGAHVVGTLKGMVKVIVNPWYGEDDFLVAYKGSNFLEAGFVYAPYLPVFATNVIMLDDFLGRRGYGTSYAKAMLNPKFYVRGKVTHSDGKLQVQVEQAA